jgi:integrase
MSKPATIFSDGITKRTWTRNGVCEQSANWYGRLREPGQPWRWVKLYTDKRASLRHWEDLRRKSEHSRAGLLRGDVDKLDRPIAELATEYHDALRAAGKDPEHVRISEWMLARCIELGKWKTWHDITVESLQLILIALEADGAVASYRNKFIARAKAFVTAFLPDDWAHPLRKLRRIREKGSKHTRERRAAPMAELSKLLTLDLPPHRTIAYALAAYGGLRRNEAARLLWSDITLEGDIPFVAIRHKMRADEEPDYVPLHSYVATLLLAWRGLHPGRRVLPSVPDIKTLRKDWTAAGVKFIDDRGRRLDYHALRHTFSTNLSRAGASRSTKKKLMRHAGRDITDGYTHAELAEMSDALEKIALPTSVVAPCPVDDKNGGSEGGKADSTYPTWVLGPLFRTISRTPLWFKFESASSCQVTPDPHDKPRQRQSRLKVGSAFVRAKQCQNVGAPWSAYVQRARYVWTPRRIVLRERRPVRTAIGDSIRAQIRVMLVKAESDRRNGGGL